MLRIFLYLTFIVLPALAMTACVTPTPTSITIPGATDTPARPTETSIPTEPPSPTPSSFPTPSPPPIATSTAVATSTPTPTPTTAATVTAALPTPTTEPSPSPSLTPTSTPAAFDPNRVDLGLEPVVDGLVQPVYLTHAGDGSGRLFILERAGTIRIATGGTLLTAPFLDLRDQITTQGLEQGLLGLAFHLDYPSNGRFFVYYTGSQGETVLSRFQVSDDRNRADPGSEMVLLTVDQPAQNHNGGMIAFGPDGYLYVGLGDGGAANDRFGNGQNRSSLLGTLLRLEVDAGQPYGVPADNPFWDVPNARPEIWAYGLRNPWRFSFDRATGDLFIADVGQNQYEEVHVQPANSPGGENYGWPIMEGFHCFQSAECTTEGLQLPAAEYDHSQGCSITGGYVYRGAAYPSLTGAYFYGDYCSGRIWALNRDDAGSWTSHQMLDTDLSLSSFGENKAGEIYALDMNGGDVYRLVDRNLP